MDDAEAAGKAISHMSGWFDELVEHMDGHVDSDGLRQTIAVFDNDKGDARAAIKKLSVRIEKLESENSSLNTRLTEKIMEIRETKAELAKSQAAKELKQKKIERLEKEIEKLKMEVALDGDW